MYKSLFGLFSCTRNLNFFIGVKTVLVYIETNQVWNNYLFRRTIIIDEIVLYFIESYYIHRGLVFDVQ